jgi:hypothetical protein
MGRGNVHAFRFHDKIKLSCETEYFTLFNRALRYNYYN